MFPWLIPMLTATYCLVRSEREWSTGFNLRVPNRHRGIEWYDAGPNRSNRPRRSTLVWRGLLLHSLLLHATTLDGILHHTPYYYYFGWYSAGPDLDSPYLHAIARHGARPAEAVHDQAVFKLLAVRPRPVVVPIPACYHITYASLLLHLMVHDTEPKLTCSLPARHRSARCPPRLP